jgi:hypothetical protein
VLGDVRYGFGVDHFYLRVDPVQESIAEIPDFQLRVMVWDSRETRITIRVVDGTVIRFGLEQGGACLLHVEEVVKVAYGKIMELSLARELFDLTGRDVFMVSVSLWQGGLPIEILPVDGMLDVALGEENFAWDATKRAPVTADAPVAGSSD